MIISCEKCEKKFEISDELIPDSGRLLQCGSCSYQWHYIPEINIKLDEDIDDIKKDKVVEQKVSKPIEKIVNDKSKIKKELFNDRIKETTNKKSVGFISYLIVGIISLIAFIILADTLKVYLVSFIPNIDTYLLSLYESLIDISLFFKDLIK